MDEKNKDKPLDIPDNNPESQTKPIRSKKDNKAKVIKIAYAFALLLALGGGLLARVVTQRNLGNLNTPIEQEYVTTITAPQQTQEQDFEVRQNKTDVPDTRPAETEATTQQETQKEAEATTQKSEYAVPYKDYYTLPAGTQISKEYLPKTPIYNATTDDWRTHPAIDFNIADGSQIKAIANGKVIKVYEDALLGTVAEIDHGNDVIARYCGLNKDTIEIKQGEAITQDQVIGYLGTVPYEKSEISHLHFEIKYKGEYVDPLELMGK